MPLFTVAIPTYNRADYLPDTLACLFRQTHEDFEVIISDNGSTDNTPEVVQRFQDKRIRYVRQTSNIGPAANWLFCAEQARTEWIVFNQDDDLLWMFPFWPVAARFLLAAYPAAPVFEDLVESLLRSWGIASDGRRYGARSTTTSGPTCSPTAVSARP